MKAREVIENMVSITELSQKSSAIIQKVEAGNIQYIAKRNKIVAAIVDMEFLKILQDACQNWQEISDEGEFTDPWDYAETVKVLRRVERGEEKLISWEQLLSDLDVDSEDLK